MGWGGGGIRNNNNDNVHKRAVTRMHFMQADHDVLPSTLSKQRRQKTRDKIFWQCCAALRGHERVEKSWSDKRNEEIIQDQVTKYPK